MKKFALILAALVFSTTLAYAQFVPTPMEITVTDNLAYDFGDESLTVPVTVNGVGGTFYLVVQTHEKADQIVNVVNGYRGWHTVNKIDTTVYVSGPYLFGTGTGNMTWDGVCDPRNGGGKLPEDTYEYFVWGFDSNTSRNTSNLVSNFIAGGPPWDHQMQYIITLDADNEPLAQPVIFGYKPFYTSSSSVEHFHQGNMYKWAIGDDPYDVNNFHTTHCPIYPWTGVDWSSTEFLFSGNPVLDNNMTDYYTAPLRHNGSVNAVSTIMKFQFVEDGESIQYEDWLGWDQATWPILDTMRLNWDQPPGLYTDRNVIYETAANTQREPYNGPWNIVRAYSFDGEVLAAQFQIENMYMPNDGNDQGKINCKPMDSWIRQDGGMFLLPTYCCLHEVVRTDVILSGDEGSDDLVMWANGNGDYFIDYQWNINAIPDPQYAWTCIHDEEYNETRINCINIDQNNFNLIDIEYAGIVSFGLSCPDGFSVGMQRYADETTAEGFHKASTMSADYGSNYDGLYPGAPLKPDYINDQGGTVKWRSDQIYELYYIAFDSAAGMINGDSEPAVEDDAPVAFSVAQNTPNPFNPTTTISFTLADAGDVSIDVFNIAGQKVDTLVDSHMSDGTHSVVWDANGFSAGVYFYTVKSGDFSQTKKMTLLK